ncbi:MAG: nitroreductase family protein [Bacteroidia bacterium]|nr:nitroreductase family protein [Bacteroidia bacterium]
MTIDEIVKSRYSVRAYKADAVSDEQIGELLEIAHLAPSACNKQPWQIHVVRSKDMLEKIGESYSRDWFKTAPCVLVLVSDHEASWKRQDGKDHADVDIAILADHITLKAVEMGLGTCWVCNFDREAVVKALGLGEGLEPAVLLPLGVPDVDAKAKSRKTIEEIVHFW